MPVNSGRIQRPSLWRDGWPLLTFLLLLSAALLVLWTYWPQVMGQAMQWQRAINQQLSGLLRQVADNPTGAGWILLGVSFSYGVLHALGPGHGKVVLTAWLTTHPSRLKTSLQLTFAASLLQGGVAIALVTLMLIVLQWPSRELHLSGFWLEKVSYLMAGVVGLLLSLRAVRRLQTLWRTRALSRRIGHPHHQHDHHCGCGHQHIPTDNQLEIGGGWRTRLMVVISMGMRPCSGALVVLVFSKVIGVYSWGVLSALAMASGTAFTLSGLALLILGCRTLALRLSKNSTPVLWQQVGWATLALAGGVILMAAAYIMWFSAVPVGRGLRPF